MEYQGKPIQESSKVLECGFFYDMGKGWQGIVVLSHRLGTTGVIA